jgi:hypothetical protein
MLNSEKFDATLGAEQTEKLYDAIDTQRKTNKAADIKAAKEAKEADIFTQLANQDQFTDMISDDSISSDQKIVNINEADLAGNITKQFAIEARRYVTSVKAVDAATNASLMGDLVTRMHDLNTIEDVNQRDYLIGVENVRTDIMRLRANGELSADDEKKLNNQMKTLTSAKTADATNKIAFSFGKANKVIKTQLPPELRGEATRRLFYEVEGDRVEKEARKTGKEARALYEAKVNKVIDDIKLERRNRTVRLTQEVLAPVILPNELTDDDFIESKGFTEESIQETAEKYNLTREEVITKLRGK